MMVATGTKSRSRSASATGCATELNDGTTHTRGVWLLQDCDTTSTGSRGGTSTLGCTGGHACVRQEPGGPLKTQYLTPAARTGRKRAPLQGASVQWASVKAVYFSVEPPPLPPWVGLFPTAERQGNREREGRTYPNPNQPHTPSSGVALCAQCTGRGDATHTCPCATATDYSGRVRKVTGVQPKKTNGGQSQPRPFPAQQHCLPLPKHRKVM